MCRHYLGLNIVLVDGTVSLAAREHKGVLADYDGIGLIVVDVSVRQVFY